MNASPAVMFDRKKAVSPLIATVLLIAFAIALGAVVMNWARGFSQEREANCSVETQLELSTEGNFCYSSAAPGQLEFVLINTGNNPIQGLGIVIGGQVSNYRNANLDDSAILPGGTLSRTIGYDFGRYGDIRYVRFIPRVDSAGINAPCTGSAIQIDASEIPSCQEISS